LYADRRSAFLSPVMPMLAPLLLALSLASPIPSAAPTLAPNVTGMPLPSPLATTSASPDVTATPAATALPSVTAVPTANPATPAFPGATATPAARPLATISPLLSAPEVTAKPSTSPPGAQHELLLRARVLTIAPGYLILTTGDALRLEADAVVPSDLRLGQTIRVRLNTTSHQVRSIESAPGASVPGEIEASALPRAYVTANAASMRTSENGANTTQARMLTVTIDLEVPDDTPIGDDIYLSTERSNFSPAEQRMNRVDAHHWTTTLSLVEGAVLHYQFTRGTYAAVERDRSGGIVTPHALSAHTGLHTTDTVARWADIS
jgi:hypothetical protein